MVRLAARILGVVVALMISIVVIVEIKTRIGVAHAADQFTAHRPTRIRDLGTTKTLSILPLVDWHSVGPDLRTEMGVSYLIETDDHRILFDVGHNARQESPSPLEHNMAALGVALDSIDTIFISHNHFDHVGGKARQDGRTFSVGVEQRPLSNVRVFVPIEMTYPGLEPIHTPEPTVIGKGVASTGTIPRQLVFGWIDEQALVVHVEGRGAVLIVGCGHQTISRLLERYDRIFSEPLYGIVGGLHYPVPDGRMRLLGLNAQRLLASGDGMFAPISMDDVKADLAQLQARGLGLIGVGGHDSSDEVIAMFAQAFGQAYQHVRVGRPIVLGRPTEL